MNATRSPNFLRLLLALIVAGYFGFCCWHPTWMTTMGIGNLGHWFMDTRAVLAASDAHALGISPWAHNPLDLFNQPHTYPDAWFLLGKLHLTRADTIWIGALIGFAFLAVALLQVSVRSLREVAWSAAVLCAPAAIFGFNRGNIDLLIFVVLSLVVPGLESKRAAMHWLSVAAIFVATAMKFYPAVTAVLLLVPNRPRRDVIAQLAVLAVALLVFGFTEIDSIRRYSSTVRPAGFFTFGIDVAPHLLEWPKWVAISLTIAIVGSALVAWWREPPIDRPPSIESSEYLRFILGALVLTSCYFVTINYAYRAICTIWMAPFLWTLATTKDISPRLRRQARWGIAFFVVFLWFDALCCTLLNTVWRVTPQDLDAWADLLVLVRIPISMLLVALLLRFLVPFVAHGLRTLWMPPAPAKASNQALTASDAP